MTNQHNNSKIVKLVIYKIFTVTTKNRTHRFSDPISTKFGGYTPSEEDKSLTNQHNSSKIL